MRNPFRHVREDLRTEWRRILTGAVIVTIVLRPFESTVWEVFAIFVGVNVVFVVVVAVAGYPRQSDDEREREGVDRDG